jgi:hypothetical protein
MTRDELIGHQIGDVIKQAIHDEPVLRRKVADIAVSVAERAS